MTDSFEEIERIKAIRLLEVRDLLRTVRTLCLVIVIMMMAMGVGSVFVYNAIMGNRDFGRVNRQIICLDHPDFKLCKGT